MSRINNSRIRKEERRASALDRQAIWDGLTDAEKLQQVEARVGAKVLYSREAKKLDEA